MRLEISDLHVQFRTRSGPVHAVNGASFSVDAGEIVGLVGESGCGKSVTARSTVRLEDPGEITRGSIEFGGTDLTAADDRTLQRLRGRELALVFQDPETTLNPAYTVGEQIAEALRVHRDPDSQPFISELLAGVTSRVGSRRTRERALELLREVGIPRPEDRVDDYPHQFSGGMRQRVMLAIALARRPALLIADEPTTALDTTTQAAILERLGTLNAEYGMGILLISHDIDVVSELCDRIVVMYDGVVVESGPTERLLSHPAHPYTKALLGCLPGRSEPGEPLPTVGGSPPDGSPPSPGCVFADRCPFVRESCRTGDQPALELDADRTVRCGVPAARDADLEAMRAATVDDSTGGPASETDSGPDSGSTSGPGSSPGPDSGTSPGSGPGPDSDTRPDPVLATASSGNTAVAVDGGVQADSPTDSTRSSSRSDADRPILELAGVTKSFRTNDALLDRIFGPDDRLTAVDDVSLDLRAGETLGLVGESGCGKSTLARVIAGLESPTAGTVTLAGEPVGDVDSRRTDQLADIGVVFQNPATSLNPKRTVGQSLAEPLVEAGWEQDRRDERVDELLSLVDLPREYAKRYPRQLSGGQLQRVAIARSLAVEPAVLVLDEPTAALDVSVQATVLNLLDRLQRQLGLAYVFVSHDLEVVRHIADRVATMYLGQLLEVGPASQVLSKPAHPYTAALLEAIPGGESPVDGARLAGEPPSLTDPPSGCRFHPRCPKADDQCERVDPVWEPVGDATARCHYANDVADARNEN